MKADTQNEMYSRSENGELKQKGVFPSIQITIAWIGMLIFALYASTQMMAAGDTWVAMACGRHFVNHGVDTVEPFSNRSHPAGPTVEEVKNWPPAARWVTEKVGLDFVKKVHPTGWINQNWLTHVIFYWLAEKSPIADADNLSFNSLVYWKFTIYILAVICIYYSGRIGGVPPLLAGGFACFAMFIARTFLDIRPAGFSNLLTAVYFLILVLAVRKSMRFIWLLVPLTVLWANLHGGYVYAFIVIVPFAGIYLLRAAFNSKTRKESFRNFLEITAAGITMFLGMAIFNPFHLTNLTHTFIISISKNAEGWRDVVEWHSAFKWDNPIGDEIPFVIMFGMMLAVIGVWLISYGVARSAVRNAPRQKAKAASNFEWPKLDMPLLVVAAITVLMAIKSRRFIPLAAFTACPLIAIYCYQIYRLISATVNFTKNDKLEPRALPVSLEKYLTAGVFVIFAAFGTFWALKFNQVYLGPFPKDYDKTSVFMRMSASHVKPFEAGKFIRDNNLSGNMFNAWTEGGFLAYAQQPDPNTGKVPLKLFMDGRAQAAYNYNNYELWRTIMAGGPVTLKVMRQAQTTGDSISSDDYIKIGDWITEQMTKFNVWVVVMPGVVFESSQQGPDFHFVKALEEHPDWDQVFVNENQKILVNTTFPQGKSLFDGIFSGSTVFPDKYSEYLTKANYLLNKAPTLEDKAKGLRFALEAFEIKPHRSAVMVILDASRYAQLRHHVLEFSTKYLDDFIAKKQELGKEHGYGCRLEAALYSSNFLSYNAALQKNKATSAEYAQMTKEFGTELRRISVKAIW